MNVTCFRNDLAISCDQPVPIGTLAYISCAEGYMFFNDNTKLKSLECKENGTWSSIIPQCQAICEKATTYDPLETSPMVVSVFGKFCSKEFTFQCYGLIVSERVVITSE